MEILYTAIIVICTIAGAVIGSPISDAMVVNGIIGFVVGVGIDFIIYEVGRKNYGLEGIDFDSPSGFGDD